MSVQQLENELLDFCSKISPKEHERNPAIKGELIEVRRLIERIKARFGVKKNHPDNQSAHRTVAMGR